MDPAFEGVGQEAKLWIWRIEVGVVWGGVSAFIPLLTGGGWGGVVPRPRPAGSSDAAPRSAVRMGRGHPVDAFGAFILSALCSFLVCHLCSRLIPFDVKYRR